jgi:outer membrane lipoprotein carrier protein
MFAAPPRSQLVHRSRETRTVKYRFLVLLIILAMDRPLDAIAQPAVGPTDKALSQALDVLLDKVEKRYAGPGFRADFDQQSTITAMEVTDSAAGRLFIKRPGKMRWEYALPETQIIISDGNDLWIYRPEDNQVMLGKAPSFFADGKGAGFLADLKTLRREFSVAMEKTQDESFYVLKLVPKKKTPDLTEIFLSISRVNHTIDRIVTRNAYGDETVIKIENYLFHQNLEDHLFVFKVPDGADVLQLAP